MKRNGASSGGRRGLGLARTLAIGIALFDMSSAWAQTVVEGTVEWSRRASLGMPVTGVVARAGAAPGDRVEGGQELIALDPARFDAAVAAAGARVARLAPDVAEAQRELERAEDASRSSTLREIFSDSSGAETSMT